MNKSIKHVIVGAVVIGAFSMIEPVEYLNLVTTKAYAASKMYLKNITLSEGDYINFKDDQYSYMVDVGTDVEEITVRARPDQDNYKVKINGQSVTKDDKYKETIKLKYGKNKVEVQVDDASSNQVTYTLYIYRGGKEAVFLQNIKIDDRDIGFSKNTAFYSIELDDDTELIKFDLITEGEEYTVKVNDKTLSETNSIKLKFKGIGKYKISVILIDNETKREKLYTLEIYIGIPISPDVSGSINDVLKPNQWIIVNGRWRYNDSLGNYIKNAWFYDRNYRKYFHFNKNGNMDTGWIQDGNWYYLDGHGAMQTGWIFDDGKWYFLNSSGAMKIGWIQHNGKWYYLNRNGEMCTGWILSNGKWYLLDSSGAMETGWILQNGKWYYLNNDGAMETGWVKVGDKWYYMNDDGSMKSGEWLYYNGNWYCFDYPGDMIHHDVNIKNSGWLYVEKDNKFYYFNEDGTMNTSTKTIDGYTYKFNEDGSVNFD